MIDEIRKNLTHNLNRVENLVKIYESHPDAKGKGRKAAEVLDILRAAVVLVHASLEDVLRSIAYWKLPLAAADILDKIALVGHGPNPKKVFLGALAVHRGSSVDAVLTESVNAHLEQSNYNNTDEVSALLKSVGIAPNALNSHFPKLDAMMKRRHQIVHRADRRQQVTGSGDHKIRGINKHAVREWATAVDEFAAEVFDKL